MRDVIPVFVNIDNDPQGICDKFGVRLRPTLVLADQAGATIKKYEGEPQVPNVQQTVAEFAKKYFHDPLWVEPLDKAIEAAKSSEKKLVILFSDESDGCKQIIKTLKEPGLKDAREKLIFAKAAFKKDSEEAKKYQVNKATTLLVINPSDSQELDRIEGKKSLKDLKAFFEKYMAEK